MITDESTDESTEEITEEDMDAEDWIRFEELLEELNQELQRAIRMQAAAIESSRCLHVAIRRRLGSGAAVT